MKQRTIRGIPSEVENTIMEEARKKGISYNKALISLLKKAVGTEKGRRVYHDLDEFCGIWMNDNDSALEKSLQEQRAIDESLWK
ncbi:MAG: hypothetical protein AB2L14_24895 [Candidatus Xenobiia bacterium LiM19]